MFKHTSIYLYYMYYYTIN